MKHKKLSDGILGHAIGDALGVPHEFKPRIHFKVKPVTGMDGYDVHNQPPGTWSDDTSLSLCLAESLCQGYDLKDLATKFIAWRNNAYWTAHGEVFDIGMVTSRAIDQLEKGTDPIDAGGKDEFDNGNGSLMRILPLLAYIYDHDPMNAAHIVDQVSSVTHGHIRSIHACNIYLVFCRSLLEGSSKEIAYRSAKNYFDTLNGTYFDYAKNEVNHFLPIFEKDIRDRKEDEIESSGYVVHTLKASMWCFMTTDSYKGAVLKAVNLGDDTDTTAAVTGGMAGIYYGKEEIPGEWLEVLARREEIIDLGKKLQSIII